MMLYAALLFALTRNAQSLPLSLTTIGTSNLTGPNPDQRSLYDIIWGSLVTIFACTWLAVHPNVPGNTTRERGTFFILLQRVKLAGIAVIAPEVILIWALRQWQVARKVIHVYPWLSMTHGFMLSMGGFVDAEGKLLYVITDLRSCLKELPSEGELQDRSKSDALAKLIVALQTLWFVADCILRRIRHLHITQLETLTLAFASLNIAIYAVWWHKPMDVSHPIGLSIIRHRADDSNQTWTLIGPFFAENPDLFDDTSSSISIPQPPSPSYASSKRSTLMGQTSHATLSLTQPRFKTTRLSHIRKSIIHTFIGFPTNVVKTGQSLSTSTIMGFSQTQSSSTSSTPKQRIDCEEPMLWSPPIDSVHRSGMLEFGYVGYVGCIFGIVFGGFHCLAWYSPFPTPAEARLWRVTTVMVTALPALYLLIYVPIHAHYYLFVSNSDGRISRVMAGLSVSVAKLFRPTVWIPFLYVFARLCLIILSLTSLRALPASAYESVEWTSFVPHF